MLDHVSEDYRTMARFIKRNLVHRTAIDFGCGSGLMLNYLAALDPEFRGWGFDGSADGLDAARRHAATLGVENRVSYVLQDLRDYKIEPSSLVDLSICIEFAEHIEDEHSESLASQISACASRWIFFSAAQPGQPGENHVNCRPRWFWISLFSRLGWSVDVQITDKLYNYAAKWVPLAYWFRDNAFVLRR